MTLAKLQFGCVLSLNVCFMQLPWVYLDYFPLHSLWHCCFDQMLGLCFSVRLMQSSRVVKVTLQFVLWQKHKFTTFIWTLKLLPGASALTCNLDPQKPKLAVRFLTLLQTTGTENKSFLTTTALWLSRELINIEQQVPFFTGTSVTQKKREDVRKDNVYICNMCLYFSVMHDSNRDALAPFDLYYF